MNNPTVEEEALAEIAAEDRRAAVDIIKRRIKDRAAWPWWRRLFPYRFKVEKLQ